MLQSVSVCASHAYAGRRGEKSRCSTLIITGGIILWFAQFEPRISPMIETSNISKQCDISSPAVQIKLKLKSSLFREPELTSEAL